MGADLILWDDWSISLSEQKAWTSLRRMEIQLPSDSGPAEGEECKDLKEMGHHFLPGCVCSWWVVDQTPTCCPWSPGPYCRKLQLCCGPTMCRRRDVLLNNTIAEWLSIPTITSTSIFMSCSVFQRWNVVPVFDNGRQCLMSGSAAVLRDYCEFSSRRHFFMMMSETQSRKEQDTSAI